MSYAYHRQRALALAQRHTVARARDFTADGVPRSTLSRLVAAGDLTRTGRGLYMRSEAEFSAHISLAEVALMVPQGVVALASALAFHEMTTQLPHAVWLLLPSKAWVPTSAPVQLKIFRASPTTLRLGAEHHLIDGVSVPITCPAKTIVDCFKYRNRIGLDVAIEALRDGIRQRKATHAEINRYARACRMERVMRPYQQMLIE